MNNENRYEDWSLWRERYFSSLELEGFAKTTTRSRAWIVDAFIKWCGALGVDTPQGLTEALLADWRRQMLQGLNEYGKRNTPATVNTKLVALKGFLEFIIDKGVIGRTLLVSLAYVKAPRLLPRLTPNHKDVMDLLTAIPADTLLGVRNRAMLEVLYSSAIRRKELAELEISDLDLVEGLIRIRVGKGGKERIALIGTHAVAWLRRYLSAARPGLMTDRLGRSQDDHGRLFVSKSGKWLSPEEVTNIVRKFTRKLLGARQEQGAVSPHAFRRSCATGLIRNGANPGHVKDILGHEDFSSLAPYVNLAAVDIKEALRKFHPREQGTAD